MTIGRKYKHMKKTILLICVLINTICGIKSQEYRGTVHDYVPIKDDEIELAGQGAHIYFYWKIFILYGEPVVFGKCAATISSNSPGNSISVISWSNSYWPNKVPASVLKKVRLKSVMLKGHDKKSNSAPGYWTEIDAGIPFKPYFGTYKQLQALPKESRQKHWSFNVPGSPSWSEFFTHAYGGEYLTVEQAKNLFKGGIKLNNCGERTPNKSFLTVEWDLSAVKEYFVEQEKAKLDKEIAKVEKKKEELRQKDTTKEQQEEADFWSTPESTDTPQDMAERKKIEEDEKAFIERNKEISITIAAVEKEKEEIEQYLATKRNKLENMPKPGENTGTFVDERDGHEYKWVKIGDQVWMAENLAYDVGRNCWKAGSSEWGSIGDSYDGRRYMWDVAKNACPDGWRLPYHQDVSTLRDAINGDKDKVFNLFGSTKEYNYQIHASQSEEYLLEGIEGNTISVMKYVYKDNGFTKIAHFGCGYPVLVRCIKD